MKISSYLALLLSSVLIACGGGGGGASSGANTSSNIIQATIFLGTKTSAGSFTYYRDGSTSNPVSYIFAKDINNDGVDEAFFVAFETQPNTQANYSNTSIHIFGWENSVFKEITSTWLPGTSIHKHCLCCTSTQEISYCDTRASNHSRILYKPGS